MLSTVPNTSLQLWTINLLSFCTKKQKKRKKFSGHRVTDNTEVSTSPFEVSLGPLFWVPAVVTSHRSWRRSRSFSSRELISNRYHFVCHLNVLHCSSLEQHLLLWSPFHLHFVTVSVKPSYSVVIQNSNTRRFVWFPWGEIWPRLVWPEPFGDKCIESAGVILPLHAPSAICPMSICIYGWLDSPLLLW